MNPRRLFMLAGGVLVAALAVLAALTVLNAPIDGVWKLVWVALLILLAGVAFFSRRALVYVLLVILSIVLIIAININGIITGAGNFLTYVFNPDIRVDPALIVQCRTDSACSLTHAILYSAIFLAVFITGFAYTTLLERKFVAWFQHRTGPNRVGPWGLLQPLADAIKLITKEDITPAGADKPIWFIAPMIKALPTLIVVAVIPLGPDLLIPWFDGKWYQIPLSFADPNVGVLWLLAITSIGTYGVVLAGWASNNKYAMLGGLRASAQMISYELSLGLAMTIPIMIVSSLSVGDIVSAQNSIFGWFVFQNPLAAGILIIALIAEVNRSPFDLPEAEQELTAGFMTEYSGMKFASFMMAEYLGMIGVSMIAVSMFFGGYQDGFGLVNNIPILGPVVLITKIILCLIGFVWIRATLPRIRYDRLMAFGWKVMLPLALVAVAWTAIAVVIGDTFRSADLYILVSGILFVIVVGGGYLLLQRAGRVEETEESLENDPIITGEKRGLGNVILLVIGGILGLLFAGYHATIWLLEVPARMWRGPEADKAIEPASGAKRAPAKSSGGGD